MHARAEPPISSSSLHISRSPPSAPQSKTHNGELYCTGIVNGIVIARTLEVDMFCGLGERIGLVEHLVGAEVELANYLMHHRLMKS